ncbi:MAG: DNA-binding protein [Acidobacteria bacterium]|nr:DNA-binding protein [Acidobacteriota bacterium]
MAHDTTPSPTLAEREAAAYVGYRPSALRAWRIQSRGPAFVRAGRSVRYLTRDLDAWLDAHRVVPRDSRPVQRDARQVPRHG